MSRGGIRGQRHEGPAPTHYPAGVLNTPPDDYGLMFSGRYMLYLTTKSGTSVPLLLA